MTNLLAMSAAGSIIVCFMLLFRPLTAKFFCAKWHYQTGKIAIVFFLAPVAFVTRKFSSLPSTTWIPDSSSVPPIVLESTAANHYVSMPDTLAATPWTWETVLETWVFIWLAGVVVLSGWYVYCYCRFLKDLYAGSTPVPLDGEVHALLNRCKQKLGIRSKIKLLQNQYMTSPMLVGVIRPTILLPDSGTLQRMVLELVLAHELMHVKQKDLWVKLFALVVGILHWYNPIAHVLRKDIHTWAELSCDEALASNMTLAERKRYGETILNTLDIRPNYEVAFSSSLSGSAKLIKRRLNMVIHVKK